MEYSDPILRSGRFKKIWSFRIDNAVLALLDHLREIDRRMLHFEMGYSSLYEFATQYLGLSEAAAQRRISAMKVVREIPELRAQLESGTISMTNVAAVQIFFRTERKQGKKRTVEEKKEVLKQVEGLSKRACERKLLEISPQAAPKERHLLARGRGASSWLKMARGVLPRGTSRSITCDLEPWADRITRQT